MLKNTIERFVYDEFKRKIAPNKVLILLGARRVGKTELLRKYMSELVLNSYHFFNGEDQNTLRLFEDRTISNYKRLMGERKILIIDEAQKIPDIGLKLKLIVDNLDEISVIVTGSSMFDLSNKLGEPLVGRENHIQLFPLAQLEFSKKETYFQTMEKLEERLIFGSYPELEQIPDWNDKMDNLETLINSYLLRDILEYEGIKKSGKIMDLLRLLAFQIGKEVKVDELAVNLKGISRNTVESYLDLLSKVFIIYNVRGYSNNLRKEVTKTSRWYFYDNGVRNAIIRNFHRLDFRMDKGELWENYLMSERIKYNKYIKNRVNFYFWRTYDQQELDLVEEGGELKGYEFKFNPNKKVRVPGAWKKNYSEATFEVIHTGNYLEFIS